MEDFKKWIKNEHTWLISPIHQIVNRGQRREYLHQAEKINNVLNNVESSFISFLFDIPNINSYESIYLKHLEWFKKEVDWFNEKGALKNIKINSNYFKDKYKSLM